MAEHVPHYAATPPVTFTVGATAVVGGQVVEISGNMTVIPGANNSTKGAGVAARDGIVGALVPAYADGVHDLTATGAITAGDLITVAANGTVKTVGAGTFDQVIGKALESIANGAKGRCRVNFA